MDQSAWNNAYLAQKQFTPKNGTAILRIFSTLEKANFCTTFSFWGLTATKQPFYGSTLSFLLMK